MVFSFASTKLGKQHALGYYVVNVFLLNIYMYIVLFERILGV